MIMLPRPYLLVPGKLLSGIVSLSIQSHGGLEFTSVIARAGDVIFQVFLWKSSNNLPTLTASHIQEPVCTGSQEPIIKCSRML